MRLIDVDALLEEIDIDVAKIGPGQYGDEWHFMETIERAPTIDAVPMDDYMDLHNHFVDWEPIRHGKWVVAGNTTHYYICSVCGDPGDCWMKYCPNCGARMDGEKNEDSENCTR